MRVGVSFDQVFGSGGSPSAPVRVNGQSVAITTSFARYAVTLSLPSTAGTTLGTAGNDCTSLHLWLSAGSASAGQSGGVPVQSGTISLWGIQLEVGPTATPLEKLDPRLDLANCQRFYQIGGAYNGGGASGVVTLASSWALPVTMRATPTITSNFTLTTNVTSPQFAPGAGSGGVQLTAVTAAAGGYAIGGSFTASADL
jgi:hypothetical protein